MAWPQAERSFTQRKTLLDQQWTDRKIDETVESMNRNIAATVRTAGVGLQSSNNYTQSRNLFNSLIQGQTLYAQLNSDMTKMINNMTSAGDVRNKLTQVGRLREGNNRLEEELKQVKREADTSKTRQDTVEHPRQQVSWYEGFGATIGFTKPLKVSSIPFLLAFGLMLLFMSALLLREFFSPTAGAVNTLNMDGTGIFSSVKGAFSNIQDSVGGLFSGFGESNGSLFALFSNTRFYSLMSGIALVGVFVLVLALFGVFGKTLR
jgi:hypothetical protein